MPRATFYGGSGKQDTDFDETHDYYKDLGLKKDASKDTIKNQYYKLCYEYHPDRASGAHQDKFKEITAAYEVLKNEERRKRYDQARLDLQGYKPREDGQGYREQPKGPQKDWWTRGADG